MLKILNNTLQDVRRCSFPPLRGHHTKRHSSQTFSSPPSSLCVTADGAFSYVIETELPEFQKCLIYS